MIDLGQPALHADGITVFADHADARTFHYVPDTPRLRVDANGEPELSLLKYRVSDAAAAALGQGLLSVTVDLGVADDRLTRLRSKLAARTGLSGLMLSPVSAETARADVSLLGSSTAKAAPLPAPAVDPAPASEPAPRRDNIFLARPLTVGAPMLVGDKAASFVAVLSAEGATLVEAAMRNGGLPLGVVYSLHATGIRPALRARVTARWTDVYHYYENRLHGGKLLLAVDIGTTVEDLVRSEVITVEIDDLVPEGERSEANRRAVDEVQRYVVQEMFTPTLGQAPPPPDAEAEGLAAIGTAIKDIFGVFALTYTLRQIDRTELKTLTYDLSTAQAEEIILSPQGNFSTRLTGVEVDRLIRVLEPAASPEMVFDLGAARDLAAEDVDRIEVVLTYGDRRQELVLNALTPRRSVSVWFEPELGANVSFSSTVHFVPSTGDVDMLEAAPRTTDQRVIRIDPRDLYQRTQTRIVSQGVPFDTYPRVLVDLRYTQPESGWTAESTLELAAERPEASQTVRVSSRLPMLVQRRVRYVDTRGEVITLDWESVRLGGGARGVLVVGDPLPDVVDVQLLGSARFGTVVARLIVELRPRSDPGRIDTRVLTAAAPVATWSWSVHDALDLHLVDRGYDYRVTVHTTAGEIREGDWQPGVPGKLVVGEGFTALRSVSLYLVGGTLVSRGLLGVKVRFSYADQATQLFAEHEVLVTDLGPPVGWTYPVAAPDRQQFTVQVTGVGTDGQLWPSPPVLTSDLILIAPLPTVGAPAASVPAPAQG